MQSLCSQGQLEIEQHAKAGTESAADTLRTKRSSSFSFEKKVRTDVYYRNTHTISDICKTCSSSSSSGRKDSLLANVTCSLVSHYYELLYHATPQPMCHVSVRTPRIQHHPMSSNLHTDEIDGDEETQFMKKLDYLKSHSEVYLRMLNDMRRRLKELPANSPTSQQYRSVHAANVVYHLVSHPHILKCLHGCEVQHNIIYH